MTHPYNESTDTFPRGPDLPTLINPSDAEALLAKSTPGPWFVSTEPRDERPNTDDVCDLVNDLWVITPDMNRLGDPKHDAALISAAPSLALTVVDQGRAVEKNPRSGQQNGSSSGVRTVVRDGDDLYVAREVEDADHFDWFQIDVTPLNPSDPGQRPSYPTTGPARAMTLREVEHWLEGRGLSYPWVAGRAVMRLCRDKGIEPFDVSLRGPLPAPEGVSR